MQQSMTLFSAITIFFAFDDASLKIPRSTPETTAKLDFYADFTKFLTSSSSFSQTVTLFFLLFDITHRFRSTGISIIIGETCTIYTSHATIVTHRIYAECLRCHAMQTDA